MAQICPYDGNSHCKDCTEYRWNPDEGQMACFLGSEEKGDDDRTFLRMAYKFCKILVNSAPPENELDNEEVTEMYDAAEHFCKAVENLGYDLD